MGENVLGEGLSSDGALGEYILDEGIPGENLLVDDDLGKAYG